jgi:hypothetical protein
MTSKRLIPPHLSEVVWLLGTSIESLIDLKRVEAGVKCKRLRSINIGGKDGVSEKWK